MSSLAIETDWSPAQIARGREAVWRAEMGYHWTEPVGRSSWMMQGLLLLALLGLMTPRVLGMFEGTERPGVVAILFGLCLLAAAPFPRNLINWASNRFTTHWPSRNMVPDIDFGPATVRLDDVGIAWSRALTGESLAWGAITSVLEDRDFFVLGSGNSLALMLPKTPTIRLALEHATDGRTRADAIRPVR
jgi:hypothetical protein